MTVDYDLIIIGGSTAGTYAAVTAAHFNARVALIEPHPVQSNWLIVDQIKIDELETHEHTRTKEIIDETTSENQFNGILGYGAIYNQALIQVGRVLQQLRNPDEFGITESIKQGQVSSLQWQEVAEWANTVVSTCSEQNYPAVLASLGVDVITGEGEFCRLPHLGFVVNNRRLRGRAYLIATGSRPCIPAIDGWESISYFTPTDIWHKLSRGNRQIHHTSETASSPFLSNSWIVIGGSPIGVELAQTLARLDCHVTLVVGDGAILPQTDPEASRLVQSQLEAEGIRVLTQSPVTQVREIEGKKWVQAGNRAIEADQILLATGDQANIESLNLAGVGVRFSQQGLEVNEKLQTTNPRIYFCGDLVGGFRQTHIAQYEAVIAVKNALFLPLFKVDYCGIPEIIFTEPQLAQVGLTELQARQRYGKDVWVVRQYFKTLAKAQILSETSGFCKIIVRENGEILGAIIVGVEASELIGAIALLIRQNINLQAIVDLPHISPTLFEIIHKTALDWQRQRLSRNKILHNLLEGFFNLRRKWSK